MSVRWLSLVTFSLIALTIWGAPRPNETCRLTIQFVDSETGESLAGLLRITDSAGQPYLPAELLARDLGRLPEGRSPAPLTNWSVLLKETTITVPRGRMKIEALSGLETELSKVSLDLTHRETHLQRLRLKRIFRAADQGYRSANTHVHLMRLTRAQADQYLMDVCRGDGLDMLFLSYLQRPSEEQHYISNRYSREDLAALSKKSGVIFGNGEEHRHNLANFGEGYGHVMLLDIPGLIQPVSLGKGILGQGNDGIPVQRGIDLARKQGGTAVWCHNDWGLEDIPNWITGRLQAQNIFDGAAHGSYQSSFYRYLNAGLHVPFSTGTDWFIYDFSRVYVQSKGNLSPTEWLKLLAAGKSQITNGAFLEFKVNQLSPGDTVGLERADTVTVSARAVGRIDFKRIEVVQNGTVIRSQPSRFIAGDGSEGHYEATLRFELPVAAPSWVALRIPPPPSKEVPELREAVPVNELGQPLFAHTSPVYVTVAGKGVFHPAVARGLITEMQQVMKLIEREGEFTGAVDRERVLDVYREAIDLLTQRLNPGEGRNGGGP